MQYTSVPFAFGYAVASDAAKRHKGDTCLRFSPKQHYMFFRGPDNTMDVGRTPQKEPLIELMKGSKNGGYLLSHNMQYHRRC